MSDVHAEPAPEGLMDPTAQWGAHVVAAKGARGARVGGGVTVLVSRRLRLKPEAEGGCDQVIKGVIRG